MPGNGQRMTMVHVYGNFSLKCPRISKIASHHFDRATIPPHSNVTAVVTGTFQCLGAFQGFAAVIVICSAFARLGRRSHFVLHMDNTEAEHNNLSAKYMTKNTYPLLLVYYN